MAEVDSSTEDPASSSEPTRRTLNEVQATKRLHPMTLLQRVLVSLPALALVLFPAITSPDAQAWVTVVILVLYGVVALPIIVLQYLRFSYRITPKEIIIQSGVLNRQNRSIPIERVQNIQIQRSLIPRLFGTAKVSIETAGSSTTEGSLEWVSLDEAYQIRRVVRSFKRKQVGDEPDELEEEEVVDGADTDDARAFEDEGELLLDLSLHRVLLSGMFRFSLLYIAIIFSGLQFVNPDPEQVAAWFERGPLASVAETATQSPVIFVLGTIVVAGLFSWIAGILVDLNRYYNFHLWRDDDKLRLHRGLLTLSEGTVPLKKIQVLILRTNPLMEYFGWYRLKVQTVGLNVEEQGHRVVAPLVTREEAIALAQHIRPITMPDTFESVSLLTIRRAFVRFSAALILVTAPIAYFAWSPAWWALTIIPLLLLFAFLRYAYHGYSLQDDGLYVRRGVMKRNIWMIPNEKFHVFYTTASIFQQRLDLKTLFVDTAGAASFSYPEIIDLAEDDADDLLDRLYDQFQALYDRRIERAYREGNVVSPDDRPTIPKSKLHELADPDP